MKKPKCTCDKFFTDRGYHDNKCKLQELDYLLNDFGCFSLRKIATTSNEVSKNVTEYINQLKTK